MVKYAHAQETRPIVSPSDYHKAPATTAAIMSDEDARKCETFDMINDRLASILEIMQKQQNDIDELRAEAAAYRKMSPSAKHWTRFFERIKWEWELPKAKATTGQAPVPQPDFILRTSVELGVAAHWSAKSAAPKAGIPVFVVPAGALYEGGLPLHKADPTSMCDRPCDVSYLETKALDLEKQGVTAPFIILGPRPVWKSTDNVCYDHEAYHKTEETEGPALNAWETFDDFVFLRDTYHEEDVDEAGRVSHPVLGVIRFLTEGPGKWFGKSTTSAWELICPTTIDGFADSNVWVAGFVDGWHGWFQNTVGPHEDRPLGYYSAWKEGCEATVKSWWDKASL